MSNEYRLPPIWALVAGALMLVVACGAPGPSVAVTTAAVPVEPIGLSFASWGGFAWLPSGWIVADRDPDRPLPMGAPDLVAFQPDGTQFARLPIGPRPECWRDETFRPTTLMDGRLGLVRICHPKRLEKTNLAYSEAQLAAFNPATQELEVLADLGDVWLGDIRLILYEFAWDTTQKRGVAYFGNRICDALVRVDASGAHPIDVELGDPRAPFRLDAMFEQDCSATARVRDVAYSRSGRLAFAASPSSAGIDGMGRLDEPFDIYASDIDLAHPELLLAGVRDIGGLAWSPDSRWLLFNGHLGGAGARTWLYNVAQQRAVGISEEWLPLEWSPDGRFLLGQRSDSTTDDALDGEIVRLDVSGIVDD